MRLIRATIMQRVYQLREVEDSVSVQGAIQVGPSIYNRLITDL